MQNDPAYAMWMATGYDPETGVTDPRTMEQRFEDEAKAMHERTNSWQDRDGGSGVSGTNHESTMVDPNDRGAAYDAVTAAVEDGHTVPMFVGDDTYPGHIVLVTASSGDSITVYDPATGQDRTITRDQFETGNISQGSQKEPWFVVVPER